MTGCTDEIIQQQLAVFVLLEEDSEVAWQLWHMYLKANDRVQDMCCSGSSKASLALPEAAVQNRRVKAEHRKLSQAMLGTFGGLLLAPAGGLLYRVGGISQGSVCSHTVVLPPPQLISMHLIGVPSQVMTYIMGIAVVTDNAIMPVVIHIASECTWRITMSAYGMCLTMHGNLLQSSRDSGVGLLQQLSLLL